MINNIKYLSLDSESLLQRAEPSAIPSILHMIWLGELPPPDYFINNVKKWKELMPTWHFMIWTNDHLTTAFIDHNYLSKINLAKQGAQKADLLRYYVINKYGGFYVDADITPMRSLNDLLYIDHSIILCNDMPINFNYIANSFFGSMPNHPVFNLLCNHIIFSALNTEDVHVHTGPGLFGKCLFAYNWANDYPAVLHPSAFYKKTSDNCIPFMEVSNKLYDIKKELQLNTRQNSNAGPIFFFEESEDVIHELSKVFNTLLQKIQESNYSSLSNYDMTLSFGVHEYLKTW